MDDGDGSAKTFTLTSAKMAARNNFILLTKMKLRRHTVTSKSFGTSDYQEMKKSSLIYSIALLLLLPVPLTLAENTEKSLDKRAADLEQKQLELEKKSLDLQRQQLELDKTRQQLQAQESGRSLSMNLSGDVLFDYDKAILKPAAEDALKKVAVVLSQFPESTVTIEGFTDAKGGKSVNMSLSLERATAVKDWLVKNGNVPAAKISAKGLGEDNPVAPNKNADGSDNPAGRALNRRVSIIVEKPSETTATP